MRRKAQRAVAAQGDHRVDAKRFQHMEDMVGAVPVLRGPGIGARRVENRAPHPVDAAHGLPVQTAHVVGNALDIVRIYAEKSLPAPAHAGGRKSDVKGKSGSERVDLGGRGNITKQTETQQKSINTNNTN